MPNKLKPLSLSSRFETVVFELANSNHSHLLYFMQSFVLQAKICLLAIISKFKQSQVFGRYHTQLNDVEVLVGTF